MLKRFPLSAFLHWIFNTYEFIKSILCFTSPYCMSVLALNLLLHPSVATSRDHTFVELQQWWWYQIQFCWSVQAKHLLGMEKIQILYFVWVFLKKTHAFHSLDINATIWWACSNLVTKVLHVVEFTIIALVPILSSRSITGSVMFLQWKRNKRVSEMM